jgi:hypothetical protein
LTAKVLKKEYRLVIALGTFDQAELLGLFQGHKDQKLKLFWRLVVLLLQKLDVRSFTTEDTEKKRRDYFNRKGFKERILIGDYFRDFRSG